MLTTYSSNTENLKKISRFFFRDRDENILRQLFEYRFVFADEAINKNKKHSPKTLNVSTKIYVKIKTMHAFWAQNERLRKKVESALHYVGVTLT